MSKSAEIQNPKAKTVKLQVPENTPRDTRLETYKLWLGQEDRKLRELHISQSSGMKVVSARSNTIDQLLQHLFDYDLSAFEAENGKLPFPIGILALGGYGRAEMCPYSDVDIMFLYPEKVREKILPKFQKIFTEQILYMLWDLGFKVGHSTRTIKQAMEEASSDVLSKNAMLESRLVAGSESLYEIFEKAFKHFCEKQVQHYIVDRLRDQKDRRIKYGDTVLIQEPDIKNGVGGLRDYQSLLWMSQIKLGSSKLKEMVEHGYLSKEEKSKLKKAYDFLLRTRNEVHFQSGRVTDLLTFELQYETAKTFNYPQEDPLKQVEAFMRDYYKHAQNIYKLSVLLEQRLAIVEPERSSISFREVLKSRRMERPRLMDGFMVRGKELTQENRNVFKDDPIRLIRVFRHCQQLNLELDFNLRNLISKSLHLVDDSVINSIEANETFRSILSELGNVFPTLYLMHDIGVLGQFMPEFEKLTCLVQHEYYHRYTIDFHVLNTIKQLDQVLTESTKELRVYREEFHNLDDPAELYLILLLHDIGKGVGIKGHDKIGAKISKPILHRMGIDPGLHKEILFIISNHLEMSRFWQHHDIDDPQNIQSFAKKIENQKQLSLLFIHTYCDARGTSSSLWNSYKDMLHHRLFAATKAHYSDEQSLENELKKKKAMIYESLLSRQIEDVSQEEVHAHCNLLPERYFVHNSVEEIETHIKLVNQLLISINEAESLAALAPVIDWTDDFNRGHTVVTAVTWDRAGLFYRLAGSFSLAGLNIVSAKAINRMDNITIDTFYVCDAKGGIVQSKSVRNTFEQCLDLAVVKNNDLTKAILEKSKAQKPVSPFKSDKHSHTPFPQSIDVYRDAELQKTVVEIEAYDKIGLLYFLGKEIYEQGYDMTFARIATERNIAVDTFYIENSRDTTETKDDSNLVDLKNSLAKVIDSDNLEVVG
ncbi:MAG: [protein-PII] uridylyltransferase [Verrucomicrobia bacterium]|nr:[protein-PII] uridylyltransferase [Verrucomicrobiota bacterium]MDA1065505.1 [protein-PII] uridylyltransferase [Verrucomicrobiota bacterium]